mgnify:FL=1
MCNSSITYRRLKEILNGMIDEELDCSVTIYDSSNDEWYDTDEMLITVLDDVVNAGTPYLEIKT